MARKSLRPQLNQIRAWVRQGRTEAWIAHQLEVSTSQLQDFIKRNALNADDADTSAEVDLRDEIEAEIEAAEEEEAKQDKKGRGKAAKDEDKDDEKDKEEDADGDGKPRRRRRRRGGRGRRRRRPGAGMAATFEHGEKDGYGLWLDASIKDDPIYKEKWAEVKDLKVTVEPDRIVLERAVDPEEPKKDEPKKDEPEDDSGDDSDED